MLNPASSSKLSNPDTIFPELLRPFSSPQLLKAYKGYNLVGYNDYIYGIPISIGHIDLTHEADRNRPGIILSETMQKVQELIDQIVGIDYRPQIPLTFGDKINYYYRREGLRGLTSRAAKFLQKRLHSTR